MRMRRGRLDNWSKMMVARTVAIDEAVRDAASPQVVILGAGLDGRAWRMSELADVTVFEVDHPDSQREKRARAAPLKQAARDVRFVPVDFTRDRFEPIRYKHMWLSDTPDVIGSKSWGRGCRTARTT